MRDEGSSSHTEPDCGPFQIIRLLQLPGACLTTNDQRPTTRYSVTSHSNASSRVLKIGNSRCEKLLKFS
jgi:hypothetical protein